MIYIYLIKKFQREIINDKNDYRGSFCKSVADAWYRTFVWHNRFCFHADFRFISKSRNYFLGCSSRVQWRVNSRWLYTFHRKNCYVYSTKWSRNNGVSNTYKNSLLESYTNAFSYSTSSKQNNGTRWFSRS